MQVKVKLFASFRVGRFTQATQDLAPDTSIATVIADLGITGDEVGIILVNGRHAAPEQVLHDGAQLALFPLLGGG